MPPIELGRLSLRRSERGLLIGGTGVGKSTLADVLGEDFVQRYQRVKARRLILDSKPRYRGERTVGGLDAKRRYKNWDHGAAVRNSVVVDDPNDIEFAFSQRNCSTVIVQGESSRDIPRLVYAAHRFLMSSRAKRPQLLQVDESLDFFHPNGQPRGGDDSILRSARAGRERGTAALYCSQRTRGIPPQLMEELERLYAFRLDYKADAKRFQEMGAPEITLPRRNREFVYWWKGDYDHVYGPYKLNLG